MRTIFLIFSLFGFFNLFGQTGNYFLSHFSPTEKRFDNVCFDMAQDEQGLMYFATRSGVIEFDGRNWTLIAGTSAVYSLQVNKQNQIFWSGASGYGTIGFNDQGFHELQTISTSNTGFIQSLIAKEKVFFLSDERIDIIDANQKPEATILASKETGAFAGMFELFGVVYINTQNAGIQKIQNNKLVPSTLGFGEDDEIIFSCGLQNYYLIGLANNKIYLCGENLKPREIILEDQAYADASVIVSGTWVNRDLFALGTLRGGMLFIHTASGKTQEIVNYTSGLPDNEVYALMSDKSQSIWVAHEYGFTRVAPFMPFRSFRHYPGIQGNLLCAISYQNQVYAGTSLGLFKLEKVEVYDEIVYYEDVEIKMQQTASTKQPEVISKPTEEAKPIEPEAESKRKGFLSFLKKNRNKTTEPPLKTVPAVVPDGNTTPVKENINPVTKPAYKRIKKTERVLRASNYVFKKVAGIDAKVNQLLEANGELIAVGLSGAFKVDLLASEPILEAPIRFAYSVNSKKILLISTYDDAVLAFEKTERGWQNLELISNTIDDQIHNIFEGIENELWLCGLNNVYRLNILTFNKSTIETIPFSNPNFDELVGIRWKNEITIANTYGFYRYDRRKKIFNLVDSLAPPNQYFASKDNIWYRNAHQWNVIGQEKNQSNLQLLNLFQDLRFITSDKNSDNLWLITGDNELYKFFGEKLTPYTSGYPLMLKAIHNGTQKFGNLNQFKIDQLQSAIMFEVIQPDYVTSHSIEYRYKLKGLAKDWSDWSSANNIVDFPYLPSGDYTLLVEAKDIFGKVLDIDPIAFEVLPPYWKRPWFYALEFMVFAILVLLSLRLSKRYLVISRVLSLLTIIMLIQFIQTVATEIFETRASPVMDFFLQVIVALMILPAEGYLRGLMLRAANPQGRIHKFISRKEKLATKINDRINFL